MTEALDTMLADTPAAVESAVSVTSSDRKCRRHVWLDEITSVTDHPDGSSTYTRGFCCVRCGVVKDPVKSRRGKSSRRLGNDQERRAEKRYGWEKIGERGEKTDLRGRFAKVQQKASRKDPPRLFRDVFAGLDATRDGRVPLLLLSYVRQGVPTEDYIVLRGDDWLEWFGRDELP